MSSILTPHGYTEERWEGGEIIRMNLYTCCHCQFTWEAPIGSLGGKLAGGFCGRCVGYVCRNPDCLKDCIPWEQRLENREAGLHYLTPKPTMVAVPDLELIFGKKHA